MMFCNKELSKLNSEIKDFLLYDVKDADKEKIETTREYFKYKNIKYSNSEINFKAVMKLYNIISETSYIFLFITFIPMICVGVIISWKIYTIFYAVILVFLILQLAIYTIHTSYAMNNWKLYLNNDLLIFNMKKYM